MAFIHLNFQLDYSDNSSVSTKICIAESHRIIIKSELSSGP